MDGTFVDVCQKSATQAPSLDPSASIDGGIVAFVPGAAAGESACADAKQKFIMTYPEGSLPNA
jgi:hypothetical protein